MMPLHLPLATFLATSPVVLTDAQQFVQDFAVVMLTAGITAVVFHRLKASDRPWLSPGRTAHRTAYPAFYHGKRPPDGRISGRNGHGFFLCLHWDCTSASDNWQKWG